jgi:putative pyruvate formate lyase activating enzyme
MFTSRRRVEAIEAFRLADFLPRYHRLAESGELSERANRARQAQKECRLCPRDCRVNRLIDERRFCKTGVHAIVSSAFPHHGEEDCLRGTRGSGTIFFSSCNLRCVFCQNADISQGAEGEELTAEQIAVAMLGLQRVGCHNINFVTPSHVVPQIIEAVGIAATGGLCLPLVYNTNAYDALATLELLDGIVDIYMPDTKFFASSSAARLCKARDYPERAQAAIREMHRQVGPLVFGEDDVARRGVLVRHLVMPGLIEESGATMRWLADELSKDTFVNIMAQYRPANLVPAARRGGELRYAEIARRPTEGEIDAVFEIARQAGLWRFDEPAPGVLRLHL